ncbi:MAG: cytochrome c biogenesis protein ResB, partial [Sulfurimonas sp.]|nr:cytochrome c biogenesis protein ResB [Sulfurimonas sp.]
MKQLFSIVGSMKTMVVMMLIFAFAIGYATFIENDYGTITAKADVYNARWFEILQLLLTINLIYNIIKYKMYTVKKAPIFIFHLSFIVIIIGAAMTRFIGYEGTMHIRENATASTMISSNTYFKVSARIDKEEVSTSEVVYLSKKTKNSLSSSLSIKDKDVHVELVDYIPDAIEALEEGSEGGFEVLEMIVTTQGSNEPIKLKRGSFYENNNIAIDFGSGKMFLRPTVSIFVENGKLFMKYDKALKYLKLDDRSQGELAPNDKEPLIEEIAYGLNGGNFALRKFYKHARTKIISNPNASPMRPGMDALKFNIKVGDVAK